MGSPRTLKRRRQRHALRAMKRKVLARLAGGGPAEPNQTAVIDRVLENCYGDVIAGLFGRGPDFDPTTSRSYLGFKR